MYSMIARNKRNTVFIFLGFMLVMSLLGVVLGHFMGSGSMIVLLVIALIYAVVQYFIASSLAITMSGAEKIGPEDSPRLWRIVENLSITTGLPMPEVYIINDPAPNAFATGRDPKNAKVAATTGLLDIMSDAELEGVMAHEMGHVKNYDIRVSMFVFGLVVAVGLFADMAFRMALWGGGQRRDNNGNMITMVIALLAWLLAPLAATLVQLAISRQREYLADATGSLITRNPDGLASALIKLRDYSRPMLRQNSSMAHLWIANPLSANTVDRLFATHPPIEERVKRLEKMGGGF